MMRQRHRTARRVAAAVLAAVLTVGIAAQAQAADDPRDRKSQVDREREKLAAELEDTDAELAQAYLDLKDTQAQMVTANDTLAVAEATLAEAQRKDAEIADRLDVATSQEAQLTEQIEQDKEKQAAAEASIAESARLSLRSDNTLTALGVALGSSSPGDYAERKSLLDSVMRVRAADLSALQETSAVNRNRETRLSAVKAEIEQLKAESEANVATADQARQTAQDQRDHLVSLEAQQTQQAALVEDRKQNQVAKDAQLAAEQQALEKEIAAIAQQQGGGGSGAPAPSRGVLSYPTQSTVVTSPYGYRIHPVLGYRLLHAGTDLRAQCGVPIYAAADGVVKRAASTGTYGNQILLDNGVLNGNGYITSYNHLSKFQVSAGQRVSRGQVIGLAGKTGRVTACHLHFEVFVNGGRVDPMSVL